MDRGQRREEQVGEKSEGEGRIHYLCDDLLDHMPVHIREAAGDAVVVEAELLVIEAEQVQRGGMEVVAVGGILSGFEAEVVGAAICGAALDAAACHPGGEGSGIVIAAFALGSGLAAKLAGADDERAVEQAARFEIGKQGSGTGVEHRTPVAVVPDDVLVTIPVRPDLFRAGVLRTAKNLHEAHAPLNESAGEQALAAKGADVFVVERVEFFRRVGFAAKVGCGRGAELQAGGEFVGGDAGFEFRIRGAFGGVGAVERLQEVAAGLLGDSAQVGEILLRKQIGDGRLLGVGVERGALMDGREKSRAPVDDAAWWEAARVRQHHERG